ncbi:ABC transporter substrate-binding protein [Camelimonas abortus]|uniref:ABC transporter substrate-binding protein n=2 Tax=Camelimonas abortus TaxID=1017184 RepID=A0ABV7LBH6_9HYPH
MAASALAALAGPSLAGQGPVKIGVLNDRASVYSTITGEGSAVAARMAVEDFGGELFGKPVEVLVADHMHKPDVGSAIARRWFDVDGVGAIFDIYSSGVALAVQKLAEEKDRILVVSMASSRDISGKNCSPNGMQWANDGYAVANLTVKGSTTPERNTWYSLTVDYAAGHSIEADAKRLIEKNGGKFLGAVRFPLNTADFSSFLLQAQNSGAKNIAHIGGGADLINGIKQADEFGLAAGGQQFVPFSLTTVDVYGLGNKATANMPAVLSYYWGENEETQKFADRFKARFGKMPTDPQANVYSAVLHYLKAVKAAGTTETKAVLRQMKETPVNDFFTKNATIRADGRLMRDMYYAVVKKPEEMQHPDDLLTLVKKYPAVEVFIPAEESECPLLNPKAAAAGQ